VIRVRQSVALPGRQEREINDAALGGSGDLAERPKEARPHPVPLPQERELNCGPGAGGARGLAEMPIKVAGTEWDEWDEWEECGRIKVNQGESSQIKVNQACGGGGGWADSATAAKRQKAQKVLWLCYL
jgi:hypothetical protein